jgi:hypothetical protein
MFLTQLLYFPDLVEKCVPALLQMHALQYFEVCTFLSLS